MKRKNIYCILFAILLPACGRFSVSLETTSTPLPQSPGLPDLVVSSINISMVDATGRCVDGYQLFTSIMNQGSAPAEGVTAVETSSGHAITIGRLDAGQSVDLQLPAAAANGIYLINVDPLNLISESNETNNNLSYLLPTPTPYAGCVSTAPGDATATPPPFITPSPVSLDGLIYADMNSAEIRRVFSSGQPATILQGTSARFSSDGLQALFERSGDLWLAEPMDNPGVNITNTADIYETSPQWWPANPSKVIFTAAGLNDAQQSSGTSSLIGYASIMDQDGTNAMRLAEVPSFSLPALSPDGKTIAYDMGGQPSLYELGSGTQPFDPAQYGYPAETPETGMFFTSPSFSPDGNFLTWWVSQDESVPQRSFTLVKFDLASNTFSELHTYTALAGTLGWLENPVWSPGGQWIAFQTRGEASPQDLWVIHQAGGIGQRFGLATDPVWNPDSQRLAYVQWPPRSDSYLAASLSMIDVPSWNVQQTGLSAGSIPLAWLKPATP